METACYKHPDGDEVTPEEFMRRATPRYKDLGIFPYCKACKQIVDPYGVHSPNVTSRFDHKNLSQDADPLEDCILAKRTLRFRGMHPDGFDDSHGNSTRNMFFDDENIKIAYCFMLKMCGKGNLPAEKFKKCIARADSKNIWAYSGIPLWIIPYVLLTLENFSSQTYEFHFVIQKKSTTAISDIWKLGNSCTLAKVFSNSGKPMKSTFIKNPLSFKQQIVKDISGDTTWATQDFLKRLKY